MRLNLRLLLDYIVSKNESNFGHGPGLTFERAALAEGITRRDIAHVNVGEVSAEEEAAILKGGRHCNRRPLTARTIHQIDGTLSQRPRAANILPAHGQRKTVFERVIHQDRTTGGR